MGKNDFDIDFDFNEEYNFDPKAFLGDEAYDENIDVDAFSDEELGLTNQKKASEPAAQEEFDLDEHDILCYLGIGAARGAEFAIAENDFSFAEKLHTISKSIDRLLFNEARWTK